jgi:uncharacterized protein
MPFISDSSFRPKWYLINGHFETLYPSLYRKVKPIDFQRERLELEDGDFLDLDWLDHNQKKLVILTHGLEGNSRRPYCVGMANILAKDNWDILAWNCRSCSGEMNRTAKLYSHADTEDISIVVEHALKKADYQVIVLIGFSMGGAISLNYLGRRHDIPQQIKAAIGFSMPTDLAASINLLEKRYNFLYKRKFLTQLSAKIQQKALAFPDKIDGIHLKNIQRWRDFDTHYSAPMNGYESPEAFYHAASALHVLPDIRVPFYICNAQNDPLLDESCSPRHLAEALDNFYLETPRYGGHVGFYPYQKEMSWAEEKAVWFLNKVL